MLYQGTERLEIGKVELPFKFRGKDYIHKFALTFTKPDECSIIYCNWAYKTEDVAEALAAATADQELSSDEDVDDLVDFLKEHVHPNYRLGALLRKGIAFHYGQMPHIVRSRLEELLSLKKLRFVTCTSTLLQGVNLPAKNIFIENPKKGKGRPMTAGDFWNLSGRAGRLAKEFHGNIWCIFGKKWDSNPLGAEPFENVSSAFAEVLETNADRVLEVIAEVPGPLDERNNSAEQAFGRIFSDFTLIGKKVSLSPFARGADAELLSQIDDKCDALAKKVYLPAEVFSRNSSMAPTRLELLATRLERERNLELWIPPRPLVSAANYQQVERIFGMLDEVFFQSGNKSYRYHCWLAHQWMRGASLKELIVNKLKRDEADSRDPKIVSKAVREIFEDLENILRFKYVKYLKAYNDVLAEVLTKRGMEESKKSITALHLLIEFGASDETSMNLMALGLSRTTALLLAEGQQWSRSLDRKTCQTRINRLKVSSLGLPKICKDEILRIQRK